MASISGLRSGPAAGIRAPTPEEEATQRLGQMRAAFRNGTARRVSPGESGEIAAAMKARGQRLPNGAWAVVVDGRLYVGVQEAGQGLRGAPSRVVYYDVGQEVQY